MNLESYLRAATRGLWGKQKKDTMLELRGDIETRAWTWQHQGKTQSESLELAIQELGDARAVNAGLAKVHCWPAITRNVLIAGLISSALITAVNGGQAQVTVINAPDSTSSTQTKFPETADAWVSMNSLKIALEAAGIKVNDRPQAPIAKFEPLETNQPNPTPTLEFTFPGAKQVTKIQALVGLAISHDGRFENKRPNMMRPSSTFAQPGEVYLNFPSLTYHFRDTGLPFSVQGWLNPVVTVGKTSFQMGDAQTPMYAYNSYLGMANRLFNDQTKLNLRSYTSPRWNSHPGHAHVLKVSDQPGSVYALATAAPNEGISFDVAVVSQMHTLEFLSAWKTLQFDQNKRGFEQDLAITKRQGMLAYLQSKQNMGLGSAQQPAHAMLMKLTGFFPPAKLGELATPSKLRSAAIK